MGTRHIQRITIIEVESAPEKNVEDEIKWICRCLDLDPKKDKLAFEIFLHLLDASRKGDGVKTIDITRGRKVTQAAVVYHMNMFMNSGLIERRGREYFLRGGSLEKAMDEMEADLVRRMRLLRAMAERIDRTLMIR